jgi:hypothetical protein
MYLKKTISEFFFNTYLQNGPFDSWTSLMYIISDWRSFLYDFWQFNKSSWQIKWLCWQLNCTANQYFQLLSLSFRKNTTWGHTVVKPRKENKMRNSCGGGGGWRQGGHKLEDTQHHSRGLRGPWVSETSLENGTSLGWHSQTPQWSSPLPMSYLEDIRFEPGTHSILLAGTPFGHLPSGRHHSGLSPAERPSRTTGSSSQPSQGSIGQPEKFKSDTASRGQSS